ncbi:unnamed protein product [Polarella glacialis]|uniref:Toprim domain-containing protein n=2 Tax=Polarella glacialis TaxID=89957 RepID=A0A813E391_POLGL|nr:unnamed protein product [Polarella glacialis]
MRVIIPQDVDDICTDADKDLSGQITAGELYKAFVMGQLSFNLIKKTTFVHKTYIDSQCQLADLLEWMKYEDGSKAALWSVPQTFTLFFAFVLALYIHLGIAEVFPVGEALYQSASVGGSFAISRMWDQDSEWAWVKGTFAPNYLVQNLDIEPRPGRISGNNQLVGGLRFRRMVSERSEFSNIPEELLKVNDPTLTTHSRQGARQAEDRFVLYHEKYDVILERIDNLTKGFLDYNTTSFSIDALMYNELSGTFTIQEMYTELGQEGSWRQRLKYRESWTVSPYRDLSSIIPDVIFGLIIIRLLITETKELVPAVIGGFDSTMASWLFWNIIDWLAILGGFVIMGLWALIRLQVSGTLLPAILAYPTASLDAIVMQNQTYMTTDEISIIAPQEKLEEMLKNIYNIAEAISAIHKTFRSLAFFYMFVLMIKFFKSFNSNKRLEIVIGTLSSSAVDVAHFFIIFMSIFSSYAVAGMFMFGNQEEGYSTLLSSHFYTWQSYSKVTDFTNIIRSPLGEVVGFAWTLTYEGIVVRLLLTILAGIIFCAYSAKKAELGDPQTIPGQVREALQDLRDTKDFLKLKGLIFELEDEEFPAHTDELVTVKSLMKAFKKGGLSPENAEYLIRKASRHASMKQGDILLTLNGSLQLVSVIRTATEKTALLLTQLIALMKLERSKPQQERYDAIMEGFDPNDDASMDKMYELQRQKMLRYQSRTGGSGSFALANTGMSDVGRPDSQGAFGALPTPVVSPSRYSQASGSPSKDEKRRRGSFDAKFAVAGPSPLEQTLLDRIQAVTAQVVCVCDDQQDQHQKIRSALDVCLEEMRERDIELMGRMDNLLDRTDGCQTGLTDLQGTLEGADLLSVQQLPKKISQLLRLAKQSQEEPPANDPLKKVGNQLALLEQRVTNVHAGMDNVAIFHAHLERVSQEVADLANHQSTEDSLFGLLEGCSRSGCASCAGSLLLLW